MSSSSTASSVSVEQGAASSISSGAVAGFTIAGVFVALFALYVMVTYYHKKLRKNLVADYSRNSASDVNEPMVGF